MPRRTNHQGVSIVQPPEHGYPYQLYFKHPLLRDSKGEKRQIKRSIKTTDGQIAKDLAIELSGYICNTSCWKALPETASPILKTLWSGDAVDQEVAKQVALGALKEAFPEAIAPELQGEMTADQILAFIASNQTSQASYNRAATLRGRPQRPAVNDLLAKNISRVMRNMLDEITSLRATLAKQLNLNRALGADVDAKYAPKTLEQAILDFFSDDLAKAGTGAGERRKKITSSHCRRLARLLPEGQIIQEITPDMIIQHLADVAAGKLDKLGRKPNQKSIKAVWKSLSPFLIHQTKGGFKPFAVKNWIKTHLTGIETKKPKLWLEQKDMDKLLKALPDYWKDVALIQWAGGFRPEEICRMQSDAVSFDGTDGTDRIEIKDLMDGSKRLWNPKAGSYGRVDVSGYCKATLKRLLMRARGLMLFPADENASGWQHPKYKEGEGFQNKNRIWDQDFFCRAYKAELRKAAKKAGFKIDAKGKIEGKLLDSRTLRRSAGKRFLLAHDCNADKTATFLRNSAQMVRENYATLLPEDITQ